MPNSTLPQPGQMVRLRQRAYLADEIISAVNPGDATLVRLFCLDDDAQGQALEVLWENEVDAQIINSENWDQVARRGFDSAELFSAYFNTLRWNCVTATDPRLFQSPFRAGIRIEPYQLEPLRKALLLPRVNLFIADDVGLGKTIEAGLIARELLLRKKVRDIVVCCPPSMLLQWREELESRFGLAFEILDKQYLTHVRSQRGFSTNPWSTHSRFLFSQRLLIDEAYAAPLRDWLGELRQHSLLILDEAHHAAPSTGQRYAIDSQITRAVRDLAPRFEHRLFLSATPHNGHSNSFSALLEILDPQRFCRGVPVLKGQLNEVMVRRLKEDLREVAGGFPKREIVQLDITGLPADAPELTLPALLDQYRMLREQRLKSDTRRRQAASGLLIIGLQQRLLSSIEAFARTLRVHRNTVRRQWEQQHTAPTVTTAPPRKEPLTNWDLLSGSVDADDDRAQLSEEDFAAEQDAQFQAATEASTSEHQDPSAHEIFQREQNLLDQISDIAENARSRPDARIRRLLHWMRTNMCPGVGIPTPTAEQKQWNNLRILIFTQYDDTKRYLQRQLQDAINCTNIADQRIAVFHGPTSSEERERIKQEFNSDPAIHPLRILIATDAAREGLNLQAHCWNIFHFDVPWNPSRMEQRNGRVDRKLQSNPTVFCHYFFHQQRPEDRILQVLVEKTKTIRQELGSLSQVIDDRLARIMEAGIRRDALDHVASLIKAADIDAHHKQAVAEELESSRVRQEALRGQIESLSKNLQASHEQIGFDVDHFKSAISCSLKLLGASPLMTTGAAGQYAFPPLDQLPGADPTWASTLDSLRVPRQPEQKFFQWRRESPVRPVVFADPGTMDDRSVHLHLEQRVVQRLLARFRSQGFVHHDLSRACLTNTTDRVPRVILLGRLCLFGPAAARLHEELIFITARWSDPSTRSSPLTPYARDAETFTIRLLEQSLARLAVPASPDTTSKLQAASSQDMAQLLQPLQARGQQFARDATAALAQRGSTEADQMRQLLENQKKRIAQTMDRYNQQPPKQLHLEFSDDAEYRQLESNRRYWEKRLASLDQELIEQPQRIAQIYQVKAQRIEPVGLVYLWPQGA